MLPKPKKAEHQFGFFDWLTVKKKAYDRNVSAIRSAAPANISSDRLS